MTTNKSLTKTTLSLILVSILFTITLAHATTENNYKTDNSFLTDISETTHTENGYKANIIINPHTTGAYADENGYKLDLAITPTGIGGRLTEDNYELDLVPEKAFPETPDIAVSEIAISKTIVGQGFTMLINITFSNMAFNFETFHLILKANATIINTQIITLLASSSNTTSFKWNTTGTLYGNYAISAYAQPIPGEANTADNTLQNGTVYVGIPGDLNADGTVDSTDLGILGGAWGAFKGDPSYNPVADIDDSEAIDSSDLGIMGAHWGESET
jgi:hypothetical protein